MGDIRFMSTIDLESIITDFLSQFKGIEIYQNNLKNMFHFKKEDIFHFFDNRLLQLKYKILGTSCDKELNLELGESYFFIKEIPFRCYISQINHAEDSSFGGYRSNNEAVIIIKINTRTYYRGRKSLSFSDFLDLFERYEGEVFDFDEPITNRWEILDL